MTKTSKILMIIATILICVGLTMFLLVMMKYNWDFTKLSTVEYETNVYVLEEDFDNILIDTDNTDIMFVLSEDDKCKVECYEEKKIKHDVNIENNTMSIKAVNEKSFLDYIAINYGSPKITVYLPETEYGTLSIDESTGNIELPKDFRFTNVDLELSTGDVRIFSSVSELIKVEASTGNISISNTSSGDIDLSVSTGTININNVICEGEIKTNVSTGAVNVTDVECDSFDSNGSTGDANLNNVVVSEILSVTRSTGDIEFYDCDASELSLKTDTGDVTGTLLSEKIFFAETDTGSVDVPKTVSGGRCDAITDTGDISISVNN